ncbi:MAG: hypothetical protein JW900_12495 [Anaerolineae bacterium]|nr:hypothetical protein [Anaerolineae bacterium]
MERPPLYQIRVEGRLDPGWSDWFEGMALVYEHGFTTLVGPIADQSALLGILCKLGNLNVTLRSVWQLEEDNDVYPMVH